MEEANYFLTHLSEQEMFLLHFCPLAGGLGGITHGLLVAFDWSKIPEFELTDQPKKEQKKWNISRWSSNLRITWYWSRIMLGLIAGLVTFLFALGSITDTVSAAGKLLLLAFLAGLSAPSLFKDIESRFKKKALRELENTE